MRQESPSLRFECEFEDEPAGIDELERRTWAALRVTVEGRCVTEFWDRRRNTEADTIYVPTFPLAKWIVINWWALFYEPCRTDKPLEESDRWSNEERSWIQRHCFGSAESGLFLPYLHFYSNGRETSIAWYGDDTDAFRSMPGYYLNSGFATIRTIDGMSGMSEFVNRVLKRCETLQDTRVDGLRSAWSAITNADKDEQDFCRAAGRMGLDPYATDEWEEGLVDLIESGFGSRFEDEIVSDLLESTTPSSAIRIWQWVSEAEHSLGLKAGAYDQLDTGMECRRAKDLGYAVARSFRELAGINTEMPIANLEAAARNIQGFSFSFETRNHLPGNAILATVGWGSDNTAIVAGPDPGSSTTTRFRSSRGLYLALLGCRRGPRLLTSAYTWDQQASRAFAAEFLAPQAALREFALQDMTIDERRTSQQKLATHFGVSPIVIEKQWRNAGVWRELEE